MLYKKAAQVKLRIQTCKGLLSVEDVWGLSLANLDASIRSLAPLVKKYQTEDSDLDFLSSNSDTKSEEISLLELSFEILKDVYITKKEEANAKAKARETKEFNQRIMSLIAEKQENSLKDKSIEELMAMIQ